MPVDKSMTALAHFNEISIAVLVVAGVVIVALRKGS